MNAIFENQKKIEKLHTERYFKNIYGINNLNYIDIKLHRPDFYIIYNTQKYAIELTTYFMQDDEKKKLILKRVVSKYLESENLIYELYKHIGKTPAEQVIIDYKNKEDIITDIIKAQKYIKYLYINNDYWYNSNKKDIGTCILTTSHKEQLSLENFLHYTNFIDSDKTDIHLGILTKNKYPCDVTLKHTIYTLNNKKKCVNLLHVWWKNKENEYENIEKSILRKINKYEEYKKELLNKDITPDKYILIIYPEQYPLDIDDYNDLYNYLKTKLVNFKYDEIGIMLFNQILVLTNYNYKIYNL